jgi:hypothetical protein
VPILQEIQSSELSVHEKESILNHAIDLHLLGSDDVTDPGFDLVDRGSSRVRHLFRILNDNKHAGVVYVFPFGERPHRYQMTMLIYEKFRGRHLTSQAVDALEAFLAERYGEPIELCAEVREHNPLRHELTAFLQKHGYAYSSADRAFVKSVGRHNTTP